MSTPSQAKTGSGSAFASPESPSASPCPPLAFMSFACLRVPLTQLKARHEADRLKYDEDAAQLQQMLAYFLMDVFSGHGEGS